VWASYVHDDQPFVKPLSTAQYRVESLWALARPRIARWRMTARRTLLASRCSRPKPERLPTRDSPHRSADKLGRSTVGLLIIKVRNRKDPPTKHRRDPTS
jgi:hypothetical protein